MLDRMAEHYRVAPVPTAHAHRRFVGVFVVLNVGERHPLRLESVAELSIEQFDRDVVTRSHLGELVEQSVPLFPGLLMDHVRVPVLRTPCHRIIFAPCATEDKGRGPQLMRRGQVSSKRSRFMTLSHTATKSRTNFGCAPSLA